MAVRVIWFWARPLALGAGQGRENQFSFPCQVPHVLPAQDEPGKRQLPPVCWRAGPIQENGAPVCNRLRCSREAGSAPATRKRPASLG
jgi:hypothetical protein